MSNDDIISYTYSNLGNQIKQTFNQSDFLNNIKTRTILDDEFRKTFYNLVQDKLFSFYEELRFKENDLASGIFRYDNGGEGFANLMEIIFNNIVKQYDFEIFYLNPDLATPILEEYQII